MHASLGSGSKLPDIEIQYNEINTQYNNLNLQVTREQSKINALKQELQFKSNQLTDLRTGGNKYGATERNYGKHFRLGREPERD
jgi:hypothetical protein